MILCELFKDSIKKFNIRIEIGKYGSNIIFGRDNKIYINILYIPVYDLHDYIGLMLHEIGHIWLSKENPSNTYRKLELKILEEIV